MTWKEKARGRETDRVNKQRSKMGRLCICVFMYVCFVLQFRRTTYTRHIQNVSTFFCTVSQFRCQIGRKTASVFHFSSLSLVHSHSLPLPSMYGVMMIFSMTDTPRYRRSARGYICDGERVISLAELNWTELSWTVNGVKRSKASTLSIEYMRSSDSNAFNFTCVCV